MTSSVLNDLRSAIEDAMVLREEASSNDGLAKGLVATLERIYSELANKNFTLEYYHPGSHE